MEWWNIRARILTAWSPSWSSTLGHSAQRNPHTVEEVRRILLLNANEACQQVGVACVKPVRKEESTGQVNRTVPIGQG